MIPTRRPDQSFDEHQAEVARWCGYPDADGLNRDHDRLHRALTGWLGVPSHAMRDAASVKLSHEERLLAILEEEAVMHVQRWMRHAGVEVPDG